MEYIKNLLYYFASQFLPNFNPYPIKRDTQLGRRQSNQTYKFIDLDPVFFDYQQKIKIRQHLGNERNLKKVIDFYKKSEGYLDKFMKIIESQRIIQNTSNPKICDNMEHLNNPSNYMLIDKIKFLNYYSLNFDFDIIDYKFEESNDDYLKINLLKIYNSRMFELGEENFDILDERKYFPLRDGDLCYMTNFPKLSVVIWLIDIGFYDYNHNQQYL